MLNPAFFSKTAMTKFFLVAGLCFVATLSSGCDLTRNHMKIDRSGNMEFQDYRDSLATRLPVPTEEGAGAAGDSAIPSLQPYVAQPSDNLKPMPLVSISVNQTVPLRDVLYELAEQAEYDIEIDPRITGSIIFTARNRPFDMVVKRISEIAGLRYKFDEDTLRIELDMPYQENYQISYLSYIRTNEGTMQNKVSVVTGEGADTGSSFNVSTKSEADFWGELNTGLTQILDVAESRGNLRTNIDPRISAVDQNPVQTPAPVAPVVTENAAGDAQIQVQPPEATLQVTSLPTETTAAGGEQSDAEQQAKERQRSSFSVNRQGGIVSVFATERQHEKVREYLRILEKSVTAQVLIEAKVLEVSLSDEFSAGINWNLLDLPGRNSSISLQNSAGFAIGAINPTFNPTAAGNIFSANYNSVDVSAIVEAVSRFGTVKALASPRLTVLNNQSAVLSVATNEVYFELDVQTTTPEGGATQTTIDSQIRNVPEGVLINVQPSIDLEKGLISMAVRPTITRIVRREPDPGVIYAAAQLEAAGGDASALQSSIPVVNVQEMDSVVQMNSGQPIVMGGLMQDRTDSQQTGVPVLSEVPVFGSLFRSQIDAISKTELVIFLRATIVDGQKSIHNTDKDLYKTFSEDRRPLKL